MTLSKIIRAAALIITVLSLFILASCNTAEPEKADISTTLEVDSSFSGSRTVVVTFPKSIIDPGTDSESNLDKVVQKYCPDSMNYAKNISDGKIVYSFILKFESAHEYTEKTTEITGSQTVVSFSNPDTVMTSGWKLDESFHSSQLLEWISQGAEEEGFEGFDFDMEETSTKAAYLDDVQDTSPDISVNALTGYPVQKITMTTVNQKTVLDRTIVFTISQSTFDKLGDKISDYFAGVTDKAASSAEWLLENNAYNYTVKFNDVTMQELEGYTNKLLSTVYGEVSYADKSTGSTALAEQNSYNETLDFSNYIGNSNENVPIEYTYSVDGSTELSECQLYKDGEWVAATDLLDSNKYGKVSAIKSSDSLIKLRINDGKQYTASSIEVTATPLDDNKLQKSITFKYDIATGGNEASDYTTSYFSKLNKGAVQSVDGGKNTCTVTFSGTSEEINSQIAAIFGEKNLVKSSNETQFMTLRTLRHFSDHIDFSSLIVGKNVDTPIYYYVTTQSGDIIKSFKYEYHDPETGDLNETSSDTVPDENSTVQLQLANADIDVMFDVTSPNISDIIFCTFISSLIVLVSIAMIFVFRSRKLPAEALGSGDKKAALPEAKNKLAVREKKKTSVSKSGERKNPK